MGRPFVEHDCGFKKRRSLVRHKGNNLIGSRSVISFIRSEMCCNADGETVIMLAFQASGRGSTPLWRNQTGMICIFCFCLCALRTVRRCAYYVVVHCSTLFLAVFRSSNILRSRIEGPEALKASLMSGCFLKHSISVARHKY